MKIKLKVMQKITLPTVPTVAVAPTVADSALFILHLSLHLKDDPLSC